MIPIMGLIAIVILVLGVFCVIQIKKQRDLRKKYPGYPEGYLLGQGIVIGIAIGIPIGILFGNAAIGVGVGIAIGASIGKALENRHKDKIRPLSHEEKKLQKQSIIFGFASVLLGFIVFMIAYRLSRK